MLLTVAQPFANHNGGGLAFDNSGRLLVGLASRRGGENYVVDYDGEVYRLEPAG